MGNTLNWNWLLAMAWWNPMPHSSHCVPHGQDNYCPKPIPMVRPCLPTECDDYIMKPIVAPAPECRRVCDPYIRKPFPSIFKNQRNVPSERRHREAVRGERQPTAIYRPQELFPVRYQMVGSRSPTSGGYHCGKWPTWFCCFRRLPRL